MLRKRPATFARRTEAFDETRRIDGITSVMPILHDFTESIDIRGLAERSQRHHLVLIRRMQEAEIARHGFIEQAERMWQLHLLEALVFTVDELPEARRHAFAASVHREHGGVVERRREKRARFMTQMMIDVMPGEARRTSAACEATLQMMRRAVEQLVSCVDDIAQKQRVPRRLGRIAQHLRRRLHRQGDAGLRVLRHAGEEMRIV
ncbi:hypothetical protein AWB74_08657 [Caballeronia arvi]|uniref:Uncharacterized protein n=1 Tax=Caballeronia arvi TaxID=1777135 RepID=A0A158L5K8_9BURK|nr:hypothetical protein AWB74_08657 [Caballeronia arvi]